MATKPNKSAAKVFAVLDVLWRNFHEGYTPTELSKATGQTQADITRMLATLAEAGYAESVPNTGRWRVSHAVARKALQIMDSLDGAERRISETRRRLLTNPN